MYLRFAIRILIIFTINAFSATAQSQMQELVCADGSEKICKDLHNGSCRMECRNGVRLLTTNRVIYEQTLKSNEELTKIINHLTAINNSLTNVPSLAQTSQETKDLLNNTITNFNKELRSSINSRFDQLPEELAASEVMKKLKEDILLEVDKKIGYVCVNS